jgi:hypothetical protein
MANQLGLIADLTVEAFRNNAPIFFIHIPPDGAIVKPWESSFDFGIKVGGEGSLPPLTARWVYVFYWAPPESAAGWAASVSWRDKTAPFEASASVGFTRDEYVFWGTIPELVAFGGVIELMHKQYYFLPWSICITPDISAGRKKLEEAIANFGQGSIDEMRSHFEKIKDAFPLPNMKFVETQYPKIVAAGEPFNINHQLYNAGSPGKVNLSLISDGTDLSRSLDADKVMYIPQSLEMPWDNLTKQFSGNLFSKVPLPYWIEEISIDGRVYKPLALPDVLTDSKVWSINIEAGFPLAALGDIAAPSRAKPGDRIRVSFPVTNTGYKGDVGARIKAPEFEREIMQRVDSGVSITPAFEGEMPAMESYKISVTPIYLGRGRNTVLGTEKAIEIKPMNCLLHWDKFASLQGGYSELNPVQGFVAGKNLRIRGLDASVGTGGPPFLPYGGYVLSGNLGPGDVATIEYDELYYLKIEMGKEIAIGRRGTLIEKATKTYEYSQLPLPSMAIYSLKSLGSLLTRTAPRLDVVR